MDLLEQYQKSAPTIPPHPTASTNTPMHGWMAGMLIYISGGRITTMRQANITMIAIAIIACAISLVIVGLDSNLVPRSRFSEEDARRQMEEYQQIQPF